MIDEIGQGTERSDDQIVDVLKREQSGRKMILNINEWVKPHAFNQAPNQENITFLAAVTDLWDRIHQNGEYNEFFVYLNDAVGEERFKHGQKVAMNVGFGQRTRGTANETHRALT